MAARELGKLLESAILVQVVSDERVQTLQVTLVLLEGDQWQVRARELPWSRPGERTLVYTDEVEAREMIAAIYAQFDADGVWQVSRFGQDRGRADREGAVGW